MTRPITPREAAATPPGRRGRCLDAAAAGGRVVHAAAAVAVLVGLLAGVPWLLWHLAGWPLPRQIPTGAEMLTVLGQPMSEVLLGNVLACLAWLAWAAFAIETLLATAAAVGQLRRGVYAAGFGGHDFNSSGNGPSSRPTGRLATALVGAVVLAILALRPSGHVPLSADAPGGGAAVVASLTFAAASGGSTGHAGADLVATQHALPDAGPDPGREEIRRGDTQSLEAGRSEKLRTDPAVRHVVVRPPDGRVHDSLWRIAERELGSARRWGELHRLNAGRLQPDGRRLIDPDLIYPGWILRLPTDPPAEKPAAGDRSQTAPSPAVPPQDEAPSSIEPTTPPVTPTPTASGVAPDIPPGDTRPESSDPASQAPVPRATAPAAVPTREPVPGSGPTSRSDDGAPAHGDTEPGQDVGVDLPSGGWVGLGLAAAVSSVLTMARLRRRRHATQNATATFRLDPAMPPTDPPPPVVQVLHQAHLAHLASPHAATGDASRQPAVQLAVTVHRERGRADTNHADPPERDEPPPALATGPARTQPPETAAEPAAPSPAGSLHLEQGTEDASAGGQRLSDRDLLAPTSYVVTVGVRNGQPFNLDLVAVGGLGLSGEGADAAARALLATVLAHVKRPRSGPEVAVLIPRPDATRLLGRQWAAAPPPLMQVVDDLDHALDLLEVDLLTRRRQQLQPQPAAHGPLQLLPGPELETESDPRSEPGPESPLLLIADPVTARARVEAVLTLGRHVRVSAVLLGRWPTGVTYECDGSGNVTTSAAAGRPRTHTEAGDVPDFGGAGNLRLFTMSSTEVSDLFAVMQDAFSPSPTPHSTVRGQTSHPLTGGHKGAHPGVRGSRPAGGDGADRAGQPVVERQLSRPEPLSQGEARHHAPDPVGAERRPAEARPALRLLSSDPAAAVRATPAPPQTPHQTTPHQAPSMPQAPSPKQTSAAPETDPPQARTPEPERQSAAVQPTPSLVLDGWQNAAPAGTEQWSPPVQVSVLGQLRLHVRGVELRHGLRGKSLELLLYVLLNPAGASSEAIAEALWPGQAQGAASLRSAMKRLRAQLRSVTGMREQMFIIHSSSRYRPDRRLLTCDAWDFEAAARAATETTSGDAAVEGRELDGERAPALRQAVALYGGTLLDGVDYPWLEPYREGLRLRALHVFVRHATTIADADPEAALAALERALPIDPTNETLYRRVMRLQARLGRPEAISGTLHLLRRTLDDIDELPERETVALAKALQHAGDDGPSRRPSGTERPSGT